MLTQTDHPPSGAPQPRPRRGFFARCRWRRRGLGKGAPPQEGAALRPGSGAGLGRPGGLQRVHHSSFMAEGVRHRAERR